MIATSHSLLERLQTGDRAAAEKFSDIYRPFIFGLYLRHGLGNNDAEELTQEAMLRLLRALPGFEHSGRNGAFRNYVKTIVNNLFLDRVRRKKNQAKVIGGSNFQQLLNSQPDPDNDLESSWDQEHDRHVMRQLLERLKKDGPFTATSITAFLLLVLEGKRPDEVAAEVGISKIAVQVAKSRVLSWLRQELAGMIDESHFE